MDSYISLILNAKEAKERFQRFFEPAPEREKNDQPRRLALVWTKSPPIRSNTLSAPGAAGYCTARVSCGGQCGSVGIETSIWIGTYLLAILGLVKAAHSEQPLLWLAVWPAPVVLISTIFIFLREGFHFQNGVLFLGRRRN